MLSSNKHYTTDTSLDAAALNISYCLKILDWPEYKTTPKLDDPKTHRPQNLTTPKLDDPET